MKRIDYLLQGFGFENINDFQTTMLKTFYMPHSKVIVGITVTIGTAREFIEQLMGLDILVLTAFVFLIIAEWHTGIKADMKIRGRKFQSRKVSRMILKIGVYNGILFLLFTFAKHTKGLEFVGFELNPMAWLYYIVFVGIIFQLVISYFENLGVLGYKEAGGISGIILTKYNKWFEFDGEKDGDKFVNKPDETQPQ